MHAAASLMDAAIAQRVQDELSKTSSASGPDARRMMLAGTLPNDPLRAAGAAFEAMDEADVFCAVNLGLAEDGSYCFAQVAA